ncbi:PASTA domain-containing protein [Streptomyces sp. NPDC046860]|uniref:PASTA domain-containing protein n=1 Tax=Streptomyces sp. NPDC046860 TaxID=3154495 RepID=UPI0033F41217
MNPYSSTPGRAASGRPWWKTTPAGLGLLALVTIVGAFSFPLGFLVLVAAVGLLWFLPPWRWYAKLGASVGALFLLMTGAGLGGQLEGASKADAKPAGARTPSPTASPSRTAEPSAPDLRGERLEAAERAARRAGYATRRHDASADHRAIVLRSGWIVCFQKAGREGAGQVLSLAAVKAGEPCPGKDGEKIPWPTMPRLTGMTWKASVEALTGLGVDEDAIRAESRYLNDALPDGGHDTWRVCEQDPAQGDAVTARVTLGLTDPRAGCSRTGPSLADRDADGTPDYRDRTDDRVRDTGSSGGSSGTTGGSSSASGGTGGTSGGTGGSSGTVGGGGRSSSGGGGVGTVHPGSFCAPAGARGVTRAGTSMVCGPGSDGRDRWRSG